MTLLTGQNSTDYRKILFSIAFASFMVNLDTYIVNISLPTIARNFNISSGDAAWVALSYQLTVTGLLLVYGNLGDKFGLKNIFLFGFIIFTIGSLLCGISNSLIFLIVSRSIQGVGASVLYALTPAMVPKFLPQEMRGQAFGVLATVAALGIILGTPLGGLITGFLSWNWIFLINIPIGIIAVWSANRILPKDSSGKQIRKEKFDYTGAILSFAATLLVIFALNQGHKFGWISITIFLLSFTAIASTIFLILWERKFKAPLFDLNLFKERHFAFGNIANFLAYAYLAGNNFIIPFYLQYSLKLRPEETGIVFLAYPLVFMFIGPIAGKLSNKFHPRVLCTSAMIFGSIVSLIFSFVLGYNNIMIVLLYFIFLAVAYGTFLPSNNNVVMGMAPDGKQGIVSALFRLIGRIGMAVGVCLFELCFSAALASSGKIGIDNLNLLSPEVLSAGFRYSYLFGFVLLFIATIFSIIARKEKKSTV